MSDSEETPIKNELLTDQKPIATISSPSSTTSLSLEILEEAANKKLIGELIWFWFNQDGKPHYTLGQITEIELQNYMLEFSEMRSLARQRGSVNPISGLQDTHKGFMTTGAIFSHNGTSYEPSILGTVPPTGTYVYKADDKILDSLLAQYSERLFYLGKFYESKTKLPLWFHHFGRPDDGGAGEAYHIGIFGMTGSGKSTLAKMMLVAYARHPQMSIFVFDPSGEFTKAARGIKGSELFFLNLKSIFEHLGKNVIIKNVGEIVLDRWELFEEVLYESEFFMSLTIPKGKNRTTACRILAEELKNEGITLATLFEEDSFDQALDILRNPLIQEQIYPSREPRTRFNTALQTPPANLYDERWRPITDLFNTEGKTKVGRLVNQVYDLESETRPIVIVNLAREEVPPQIFWNDGIKALLINRIVEDLKRKGEAAYRDNKFLNTLVVLDEAQRLVPREKFGDERKDRLRSNLIDAVQTTRKYGLGWMFLSLSLSTLHKEIYHENRISFYGFGLSSGSELYSLKELVSDPNAIKLYQSFKDPHSVIETRLRSYSFMSRGPVSPLSFAGSPLFLTMFSTPDDFLGENNL